MSHDTVPGPGLVPPAGIDYLGADAVVVHLPGRLDPAALLRLLRDLRLDRAWVVLDLARVPELDPAALAILARTQRRLHRHGAALALWQLRAQPRQLIGDRRFHRIVEVITGDLHLWLAQRTLPARPTPRKGAQP